MKCTNPVRIKKNLSPSKYPDGLLVPCGKCLLCRQAKTQEWKNRLIHELSEWQDSIFVTLTYSEENLPDYGSLVPKDLTLFFKRVRKEISPRKIKYFATGEYGDKFQRPHYHSIIYGLSLRPDDTDLIKFKWPHGIVHFGTAQAESMAYVAKYIQKRLSGPAGESEYAETNRAPVFKVCSQGLGKSFALKNKDNIIQNEGFTWRGSPQGMPRYYLKILELENTDFRKNQAILNDMKIVEHFTHVKDTTFDLLYMTESPEIVRSCYEGIISHTKQRELNLTKRIKMHEDKF